MFALLVSPPASGHSPAPARLWTLDALRGLCAAVVFLSHWHLWSTFPPAGSVASASHTALSFLHDTFAFLTWPTGGHHPAVVAFFVLSGFCIHYPYARRVLAGEPRPGWGTYFHRRFLRIMPVYWAACLLGVLFVCAERAAPSGNLLLQLHATGTTEDFLVRFAAIGAVYPKEIYAGNYILVTVTSEIVMYALYPVLLHFIQRGRWRELGGIFVILQLASIQLLPYLPPFWVFNSVLMVGLFWYLGALAAHLFLTGRFRVSILQLLLVWALFLVLKVTPTFYGLNLLKQTVWALICFLGLLLAVRWEVARPTAVAYRPLATFNRWCGEISYSLYAMHTPAIMLATWALHRVGWLAYPAQLAATFLCSILATLAVHYAIEQRFYQTKAPRG